MFEDLRNNFLQEKKILQDMRSIRLGMRTDPEQYAFYISNLNTLSQQLRLLNRATPELLSEWSSVKKPENVSGKESGSNVSKKIKKVVKKIIKSDKKTVKVEAPSPPPILEMSKNSKVSSKKNYIVLNKKDKADFLKSLKFSGSHMKGISKKKEKKKGKNLEVARTFGRLANKLFRTLSEKLVPNFSELSKDLKKGNVQFLTSTYISMAILSGLLAFSVGGIATAGLIAVDFSNWTYIWIPFGLLGLVWTGYYLYPASEASSGDKKVSQELPFATIHMAAIAGSNIEPTKIFKIIADSKEYPNMGTEMRKVIAQTSLYGYDLVTSLKNVALRTSNKQLAELFNGLASNIATGGGLKNFLEKKSETYLLDYRLEREKYSDLAGTFMDVYISILIAAPLVLMMMFIVMNVAGVGGGLGLNVVLPLAIGGVAVVNVIFLFILNAKQPAV